MTALNRAAALCLALGLTACTSDSGDYGSYLQLMRQAVHQSFSRSKITLQQAAAVPYASMGWRLDSGAENLIVLATDDAQGQMWTSSAHIVLLTKNGRVIRTVGLPHDMSGLISRGGSLTPPAAALQHPYRQRHSADFKDLGEYGVALDCSGAMRGARIIVILGKKITATRVDEQCEAPVLHWRFTNIYWIDRDTGLVWRSLQHIHPHGDTLETEIFRPPG